MNTRRCEQGNSLAYCRYHNGGASKRTRRVVGVVPRLDQAHKCWRSWQGLGGWEDGRISKKRSEACTASVMRRKIEMS